MPPNGRVLPCSTDLPLQRSRPSACSRMPKRSARPRGCPPNSWVDHSVGMNEGVAVDRRDVRLGEVGRTAPDSGSTPARAEMTLPDARAVGDVPGLPRTPGAPGRRSAGSSPAVESLEQGLAARGSPPPRRRTRIAIALRSGAALAAARARSARTSSATTKDCSGSKPSSSFGPRELVRAEAPSRGSAGVLLAGARSADDRSSGR